MKNIFRQYDIRGVVDRDLDDHTMDRISRAFASMAKQQGYDTILVGRDNRLSSPRFRDTVVSALLDSGCNVIHHRRQGQPQIRGHLRHLSKGDKKPH